MRATLSILILIFLTGCTPQGEIRSRKEVEIAKMEQVYKVCSTSKNIQSCILAFNTLEMCGSISHRRPESRKSCFDMYERLYGNIPVNGIRGE